MTTECSNGRDTGKTLLLPFLTTPPYSPFLIFAHKPLRTWSRPKSHRVSSFITQVNTELRPICKSPSSYPLCIHDPSLKPWHMTRCLQLWRAIELVWTVCIWDMWLSSALLYTSVVGARNLIIHCYTLRANIPNLPLCQLKSKVNLTTRFLPSSPMLCSLNSLYWHLAHDCTHCALLPHGNTAQARTLLDSVSSTLFTPFPARLSLINLVRSISQHLEMLWKNVFHSISSFHMWSSLFRLLGLLVCHMSPVVNHLSSFRSHQYGRMGKCSTWKPKFSLRWLVICQSILCAPTSRVSILINFASLAALFHMPGIVDLLLGVVVFSSVLKAGQHSGPPGTPTAVEISYGWTLAGIVREAHASATTILQQVTVLHSMVLSTDDLLRQFWEIEETCLRQVTLLPEDKTGLTHFHDYHHCDPNVRFVVPLPMKAGAKLLGKSRSQAVHHFLKLERSLHNREQFKAIDDLITEYLSWVVWRVCLLRIMTRHINTCTTFLSTLWSRNLVLQQKSELFLTRLQSPPLVHPSMISCWLDPLCTHPW